MDQKIMKALARKTDDAFEKEYEELNEVGKGFSPQLMPKLLEAAKFYDMQYAAGQKKEKKSADFAKGSSFPSPLSFRQYPLQSGSFASLSPVCISGV